MNNTKFFLTFCLFILNTIIANSQPLIQIESKEKLSNAIKNIENEARLNLDSTLFFFFVPNICPRCEYSIPIIHDNIRLKQPLNSSLKTVLVIISENKSDAINAMKTYKKNFDKVAILISDENEYLYINAGYLPVPFIGRFNNEYKLSNVFYLSGKIDFDVTDFLNSKSITYQRNETNVASKIQKISQQIKDIQPEKTIDLKLNSITPQTFKFNNKQLLFISSDNKQLYLYDTKKNKNTVCKFTLIEEKLNSLLTGLSDTEIKKYKKMGLINFMLLDIIDNNKKTYVTGSFFIIKKNGADNLISMAVPFVFELQISRNNVTAFNIEIIDNKGSYSVINPDHTNLHFFDTYVLFGYEKGIPNQGFTLSDTLLGLMSMNYNPFSSEFYDSAILYECYDKNLHFIKTLGSLNPLFKDFRLGYSYTHSVCASDESKLYINDGFSAFVHVFNTSLDLIDSIYIKRNVWSSEYADKLTISRTVDHFFQLDTLLYSFVYKMGITPQQDLVIIENVTEYSPSLFEKSMGIIITKYNKEGNPISTNKYMLPENIKFIEIQTEGNSLYMLLKIKNKVQLLSFKI